MSRCCTDHIEIVEVAPGVFLAVSVPNETLVSSMSAERKEGNNGWGGRGSNKRSSNF